MNGQIPKTAHSSKIQKKRLSQEQVRLLETSFDAGKKLEPDRKFQLARELGVPPRQIAIWYQNKRARWKNQSLELDYGAVQVRLEAAQAENRALEKEVDVLRAELKLAQDMLFGFRQSQAQAQAQAQACGGGGPPGSSLSSCGDEGAGSSSHNEEVGCTANWPNVEELYECLMVGASKGQNCPVSDAGHDERDYWV